MWLFLLNTLFMLIVAFREVRRPAKALNWLVIVLVLPLIGFGLYLSTTNPLRVIRKKLESTVNEPVSLPNSFSQSASVTAHALQHLTFNGHGLRSGRVKVLTNGLETYGTLMKSLQSARRTIDMEYYIYRDDEVGRRITNQLIEKAESGVRVRFVKDGWGSHKFPRSEVRRMMKAGIECRTFFPARFPWLFSNWNYRDHCKIVVVDGKEAFTGGINIGYEYTGLKPDVGFFRDTHFLLEGGVVQDLQAVFEAHWSIAAPEPGSIMEGEKKVRLESLKPSLSGLSAEWAAEPGVTDATGEGTPTHAGELPEAYIQTLEGDPGIQTQVIREAYFICLTQASKTIDITTPYFAPDTDIIMAMKTAAARGVRIRLLVPSQMDLATMVVGAASRTYYGDLLEAGIEISQYIKGNLHAKVMIMDGEVVAAGAANYDMRSFRLNYEVAEMMYSSILAKQLTDQFEQDLMHAVPLRIEDMAHRSFSQRMLDQGARLIAPLL